VDAGVNSSLVVIGLTVEAIREDVVQRSIQTYVVVIAVSTQTPVQLPS